jgi:hypothetical protein
MSTIIGLVIVFVVLPIVLIIIGKRRAAKRKAGNSTYGYRC